MTVRGLLWRIALRQAFPRSTLRRSDKAAASRAFAGVSIFAALFAVSVHLVNVQSGARLNPSALAWVFSLGSVVYAFLTLVLVTNLISESRARGSLAALPLSTRSIVGHLYAVPVLVLTVLASASAPASMSVLLASVQTGAAQALLVSLAGPAAGVGEGLMIAVAAGLIVRLFRASRRLLYPVSLLLAAALTGVQFICLHFAAFHGGGWVLGFSLAEGPLWLAGALLALCLAFSAAAFACFTSQRVSFASPVHTDVLVVWSPSFPGALVALEVFRLLRQPRFVGSLAALGLVLTAAMAAATQVTPAMRESLLGGLITVVAVSSAHPFLLARGFSAGQFPLQVVLFGSPVRWLLRLALAVAALACVPVVALVVCSVALLHSPGYGVFAGGCVCLASAVGLLVGVVRPLRPGVSSAEAAGLFVVAASTYACLFAFSKVASSPSALGTGCFATSTAFLLAACMVEHCRDQMLRVSHNYAFRFRVRVTARAKVSTLASE